MGLEVIPIPIEVLSHSLPFPSPIPCFIPIPMGFPFPLGIPFPCTSLVTVTASYLSVSFTPCLLITVKDYCLAVQAPVSIIRFVDTRWLQCFNGTQANSALPSLRGTSESADVNKRTARFTSSVSVVSQCKLVSG